MRILYWVIGGLVFAGLAAYNLFNNDSFFLVPVTSLMTVIVTIIFSYWFVQSRNDKRKKNEKLDALLYKIQEIMHEKEFIQSGNEKLHRRNFIKQRSLGNKIKYLQSGCKKEKEVRNLLNELRNEFDRFREFYGDHYTDQEYMEKSESELFNYITKMDDIADKIHIELL